MHLLDVPLAICLTNEIMAHLYLYHAAFDDVPGSMGETKPAEKAQGGQKGPENCLYQTLTG